MNLFQFFSSSSRSGEHKISYIVKGDARDYNVTFKCGSASHVVQEGHIRRGWRHTFIGQAGDYFYISAQANNPDSAVDVRIYEDGKLIENITKKGDYPLVQASGRIT
jgi:hypothetical protein